MGLIKDIKEDIQAIFERDPAARSTIEILFCYPGLHAIIFHKLSHRLWKWKCIFWRGLFPTLGDF